MAERELTAKQERFVSEYLIDLNATQAAIRAGYSERSAEVTGSRLLSNAKVAAAVAEAKAERSEQTKINAAWVLERLGQEATADLADIYNEEGQLRDIHEWPMIWRQGLVAGVEVEEIRADGVVIGHVRKVKLSDRIKRIELIGKHVDVQAFKDQVEQTGTITLNITPDDAEL